ncbi:unnamed protein product [Blepharisma stoltei]|uniref:Uncharacterized protein n=1 Tax=Blepharisma stoltei TaxID=1481888 RepID=A0AAU9K2Q4_9CILI|nr:unnamed protein product [Blepharisma stoltei]
MPYRINTLHLYSYFNHPNQFKLSLEGGGSLFNTNFGENALSFAVKKQFSSCVSAIVSSFGKLLKEILMPLISYPTIALLGLISLAILL